MRKFARVIVMDPEHKVLVIRQETVTGKTHCFPGGKVEEGENPQYAASRELYEELGIRKEPNELKPIYKGDFKFGEETWIGHFYVTIACGKKPCLPEYPKIDFVQFVLPADLHSLGAHHESLSGVFSKVRHSIWEYCGNFVDRNEQRVAV